MVQVSSDGRAAINMREIGCQKDTCQDLHEKLKRARDSEDHLKDETEGAEQALIAVQALLTMAMPLESTSTNNGGLQNKNAQFPKTSFDLSHFESEVFSRSLQHCSIVTEMSLMDDAAQSTDMTVNHAIANGIDEADSISGLPLLLKLMPSEMSELSISTNADNPVREISDSQKDDIPEQITAALVNAGTDRHKTAAAEFKMTGEAPNIRANAAAAVKEIIFDQAVDRGWQYKFRSWGDTHSVWISDSLRIQGNPNKHASLFELQPSTDLVEQRLHSARESTGAHEVWLFKESEDGRRQQRDEHRWQHQEDGDEV